MTPSKPVVVCGLDVIADKADGKGTMSLPHDGFVGFALGKERFVLDPAELDVLRAEDYESVPQSGLMSDRSVVPALDLFG